MEGSHEPDGIVTYFVSYMVKEKGSEVMFYDKVIDFSGHVSTPDNIEELKLAIREDDGLSDSNIVTIINYKSMF